MDAWEKAGTPSDLFRIFIDNQIEARIAVNNQCQYFRTQLSKTLIVSDDGLVYINAHLEPLIVELPPKVIVIFQGQISKIP